MAFPACARWDGAPRPGRRARGSGLAGLALLLLAAAALPAGAAGGGLSDAERRGKRIYLTGESPSGGEVTALMGEAGIEVPATALPCASCHGRDGRGRPEGGVQPSDLTWEALTRPYAVETAAGRRHGPYTPHLLKRAIGLGIDASGGRLDAVMPRYRLSHRDADDLVAYLGKLGRDLDPGIADGTLTLGVLLPPAEAAELAATAAAVRRILDAYCAHLNDGGGVYQRRLELRYRALPPAPDERPAALARFVEEEGIFALVAPFTAGADAALAAEMERLAVPAVGPLTLDPQEGFPLNRQVFYLDGGLPAQLRALATAPRGSGAAGPEGIAVILHPRRDDALAAAAAGLATTAREAFASVQRRDFEPRDLDAGSLAGELRDAGVTDVFLLAPGDEAARLMAAATAIGWSPRLHVPGALAGAELFAARQGFAGRLMLAFTRMPADREAGAVTRFRRLTGDAGARPGATEIAVFLAFDLLVAGLEDSGRDLSREGLIESLELMRGRPTGLTRPLSYGPNRRIGIRGAYVVELGERGAPEAAEIRWVELN